MITKKLLIISLIGAIGLSSNFVAYAANQGPDVITLTAEEQNKLFAGVNAFSVTKKMFGCVDLPSFTQWVDSRWGVSKKLSSISGNNTLNLAKSVATFSGEIKKVESPARCDLFLIQVV